MRRLPFQVVILSSLITLAACTAVEEIEAPNNSEATPEPTFATPDPSQATPEPTLETPEPTQATPEPSQATPEPSQATPEPSQATPEPSQATPEPIATATPNTNEPGETSVLVPSRIEAEDYVRFYDTTDENLGNSNINSPVDTEATGDDEGNLNVGHVASGEWLEYDIYSKRDIEINVSLRVAARRDGSVVALMMDGNEVGRLEVPNTGGWQEYTRITFGGLPLSANVNHVLHVEFVEGSVNLNYIDIASIIKIPGNVGSTLNVGETDTVPSPLARLSNSEFLNGVRSVLNLSEGSTNIRTAADLLPAESEVSGLTSDSTAQGFSTSRMSGYMSVALAAADDFVDGATTTNQVRGQMNCDALQVQFNKENINSYNASNCFQDFARSLFVKVYGMPYESDSEVFSEFLANVERFVSDTNYGTESFEAMEFRLQLMSAYFFLDPEFLLFAEKQGNSGSNNSRTLSSTEIAKRMSFFLTASLPDDELTAAALQGELSDPITRLEHTNRLLEKESVNNTFAQFFVGWLGVNASIDQVEQSDVNVLTEWLSDWLSSELPFNELYSGIVDVINVDGTQTPMNLGVLGTKAFVASHTNNPVPSFINRGQFVTSELLCGILPDDVPSEAFAEASTVSNTPTELFHELKTTACATCHFVMDNYGGLFQQFDQTTSLFDESSQPYASSFELFQVGDIFGEFSDIESFGEALSNSTTAAQCASKLLYRHALRRGVDNSGADDSEIDAIFNDWINSGNTSIKSLIRTIVTSDHFITFYEN